jgi:hypothetical protein
VDPHIQSESQCDIASLANEAEDDLDEAEAVHNLQPNGITKNIDLTREEEKELPDPICAWGMDTRTTSALGGKPHFEQCAFAGMGRLLPCAHDGCSARVHRFCPPAWFDCMRISYDTCSPVYCPAHNDRYLNFVRQREQRWNPDHL